MNLKKIFNLANLFLLIVLVLTGANIFLSFGIEKNFQDKSQNQELEFVVLESESGYFGGLSWYVWHAGAVWQLKDTNNFYKTGRSYLVQGKKQSLEIYDIESESVTNFSDRFLGVVGKIEVKNKIAEVSGCNWLCLIVIQINNFKYNLRQKYLNLGCNQFNFVSDLLAPGLNCKDISGFSTGLVLGGMEDFSPETKNQFKILGLTHLVAVSGFQVVLVITFLESILNKLNLKRKHKFAFYVLAIAFLLALVGPQPPVVRSAFSSLIAMFSLFFLGRKLESWRVLTYSALVMLWFNPFYIFSVSFQLSFMATAGLLFFGGSFEEKGLVSDITQILKETLGSFLFTLPIIINLSGFVSLLSILSNVLVVPFISIITILNILVMLPIIGDLFFAISYSLQSLILFLIDNLSEFSLLLNLTRFSLLEILTYYLFLIVIIYLPQTLKKSQ